MKVLHIGEYVSGGVATYIREVLKYQENSPEIEDVSLVLSEFNSETKLNSKKVNLYTYKYKRNLLGFFNAFLSIRRCIKNLNPDIVHIHSSFAGFITRIYLLISFSARPKIVYCSHGWSFLIKGNKIKTTIFFIVEWILSKMCTDLIINISNSELQASTLRGIPSKKSTVIYNGVANKSRGGSREYNSEFASDKINLLFVGRFDKQKGVDILIEVFKSYKFENVKLYLIGDKVLNNEKVDIPINVEHLGWVDNESINFYYEKCDAVIMPSRWEGFGLVAIEAMRNKKAVIASNQGALPEIVKDNINGKIFDINCSSELKELIRNLKKQELTLMGLKGFEIYNEKFTSEKMNVSIINAYKKCLY